MSLIKTLYYRLYDTLDTSKVNNASILIFATNELNNYHGLENRFMMDANGVPNNDVISILGFRTFGNPLVKLPALYNETINIQTKNGFVNAQAVYNDNGRGFATELPYVEYCVLGASGEFVGAKILTIFFDNINYTRIVKITG